MASGGKSRVRLENNPSVGRPRKAECGLTQLRIVMHNCHDIIRPVSHAGVKAFMGRIDQSERRD